MQYFRRQHLENHASKSDKSNRHSLLVDEFGVHRNMYRAPKAFLLDFSLFLITANEESKPMSSHEPQDLMARSWMILWKLSSCIFTFIMLCQLQQVFSALGPGFVQLEVNGNVER